MDALQVPLSPEARRWLAEQAEAEGYDDLGAFLARALQDALRASEDEEAAADRRALAAIARLDEGRGVPMDDEYAAERAAFLDRLRAEFGPE